MQSVGMVLLNSTFKIIRFVNVFLKDRYVQPQDPSAFLKAMLKIPDVNPQTSKQESKPPVPQPVATLQKVTVPQKDQNLNPPPLVQQLFDVCIYSLLIHARVPTYF